MFGSFVDCVEDDSEILVSFAELELDMGKRAQNRNYLNVK